MKVVSDVNMSHKAHFNDMHVSHYSTEPTRKQTVRVNVILRSNGGHSNQQGHKVMQSTSDNVARLSCEIFVRVC